MCGNDVGGNGELEVTLGGEGLGGGLVDGLEEAIAGNGVGDAGDASDDADGAEVQLGVGDREVHHLVLVHLPLEHVRACGDGVETQLEQQIAEYPRGAVKQRGAL